LLIILLMAEDLAVMSTDMDIDDIVDSLDEVTDCVLTPIADIADCLRLEGSTTLMETDPSSPGAGVCPVINNATPLPPLSLSNSAIRVRKWLDEPGRVPPGGSSGNPFELRFLADSSRWAAYCLCCETHVGQVMVVHPPSCQ